MCRKFITIVPHVHNIASQTMGKVYFDTVQCLWLTNIMIAPFMVFSVTHTNCTWPKLDAPRSPSATSAKCQFDTIISNYLK